MYFLNEWEIDEQANRHRSTPVLDRATRFLSEFRDEVNSHSDGWAYWRLPVRAAKGLMTLIMSGTATEQQLVKALSPIKAFYTRRGYAAGMKYPTV